MKGISFAIRTVKGFTKERAIHRFTPKCRNVSCWFLHCELHWVAISVFNVRNSSEDRTQVWITFSLNSCFFPNHLFKWCKSFGACMRITIHLANTDTLIPDDLFALVRNVSIQFNGIVHMEKSSSKKYEQIICVYFWNRRCLIRACFKWLFFTSNFSSCDFPSFSNLAQQLLRR